MGLLLFWIALVGSHDLLELAVGVAAAVVGAAVVVAVQKRGGLPSPTFRRRTWSRAGRGLTRIPADLRVLAGGLRAAGSVSTSVLPTGTDWRRRAERGSAELFGSLAPNTIVIDVTPGGDVHAHQLVKGELP